MNTLVSRVLHSSHSFRVNENVDKAVAGAREAVATVVSSVVRTSNDLWALKVLVGVQIAGLESKVQTDEDQEEVCAPPHGWLRKRAKGMEG